MKRLPFSFSSIDVHRPRGRVQRCLVLAATVVVALCAGLIARAASGDSLEVVSFYPSGAPDTDNLVTINKSFEATHPGVKVNLTFGGGQDTPQIVQRWRAGNPPEVNFGFFDGTNPDGLKYQQANQVYDLTSVMQQPLAGYKTSWKKAILPQVLPFITSPTNHHIYAAPREITVLTFFYNKQIFAKNHLAPPKTYPQFLAVCAKLKKSGVAPLTVTGTFAGYMQFYYDYLLLHRGLDPAVTSAIRGKRSFASIPGVLQAAQDLQKLTDPKKGYFLNGFEGTDFTAAQLDFFQGKSAMILMGTWLVGEMKASIPPGFKIGTFPFPAVPGGKANNAVFGVVNNLVVAAQSKRPDLGAKWLQWFARKDIQTARVRYLNEISPYKGVAVKDPTYGTIIKNLQAGGSFWPSYFGLYGGATQGVRDAYQQPIVKMFFGKIDAAEMVKEIDASLKSAPR